MIEPVKKSKLYETIVNQILGRIKTGELRSGDRLPPERELVESMQASRPTIREALRSMESMGYLESRVGGGTFIRSVRLSDVMTPFSVMLSQNNALMSDLFDVRIPLECEIVKLAARRINEEKKRDIAVAIDQMRDAMEKEESVHDSDDAFHESLARAADNVALSLMCELCSEVLSKSRETTRFIPGKNERTLYEHTVIYEAIARGDDEAAVAAMRIHLSNARMNFL